MGALDPALVARAEREIRSAARLYETMQQGLLNRIFNPRGEIGLLEQTPGLEQVMLFHSSGYMREAALARIGYPLPSAFMFASVAWRLNDWVPQVRAAARACAERTFPATDPDVIAQALISMLSTARTWQRWTDNSRLLFSCVDRAGVAEALAARIQQMTSGAPARALRELLRHPGIDRFLPELSRDGAHPLVRAVALETLLQGEARWCVGYDAVWVDKVYGISRSVPRLERRQLAERASVRALIEQGARDKAVPVRRVAVSALLRNWTSLEPVEPLIALFSADLSPPIKSRLAFLARERTAAGG